MEKMKIGKNTVVSLAYTLQLDDNQGEVVEQVEKENPAVFLVGAGILLEKFEENLDGLNPGDSFSFGMTQDEAYGPMEEDALVDVPLKAFEINGQIEEDLLAVGSFLPMRDMDGQMMHGRITEIGEEYVTMDFNHPLAGQNLYFTGEVIDVREASPEELAHGHVHGDGGHHH